MAFQKGDPVERFWAFVNKTDTCWLWTGETNSQGYGRFAVQTVPKRVREFAHRFSYQLAHGDLSNDVFVLHTCDTPLCVNPQHLRPGTHQDNMNDAVAKGRMCKGSKRPQSKLSEGDVMNILALQHTMTHQAIADQFGVRREAVSKIIQGIRWRHLSRLP